ncbi:MAG TPA: NADH-quinone oxidoreductase subunit N [Saprospiraceae bacterium]
MYTLIYTCCLGLLCLVAEILNVRKLLIPMILAGLVGIFFVNFMDWQHIGPIMIGGMDMAHMIQVDKYTVAFNAILISAAALVFALSADFYKEEQHHLSDYLAILIFILCGAMVLTSFSSLVMLFLGIEIVSISLYIMAGSRKYDIRSNEAGFKYFLMGSFASAILLFGIALVYGSAGSFELSKISAFATASGMQSPMFLIGALLMVVAMLFKVAAVPFHFWSPDVYEGSPSLVTTVMATLVKVTFFAAFYRLMAGGLFGIDAYTSDILVLVAAITMIVGNLAALNQQNFKRLLAYSGISHAGYMLLAILSLKTNASSALFFYGASYMLATIGAFAIAIPVFNATGKETIDAFDGLGRKKPFLAAMLTMSMLSLAGIPPLAGFLGKYYIFSEAIKNGYVVLTLLAVVASIIGVYYYFKVILAMYTKPGDDTNVKPTLVYTIVTLICVGLSLLLGVWPGGLMGLI